MPKSNKKIVPKKGTKVPNKGTNSDKRSRGQPTKYKPEYNEKAYKLCLLGATDKQMADFFGVDERTITRWKKEFPEFCLSLRKGKIVADAEIAESLYHRAKGYSHPEDKIFNDNGKPLIVPTIKHYPPDTAAAIIWLKNRQPDKWRDKTEHEFGGDGIQIVYLTEEAHKPKDAGTG